VRESQVDLIVLDLKLPYITVAGLAGIAIGLIIGTFTRL